MSIQKEEALRRVRKCQNNRTKSLNLSNLNLSTIPVEVSSLYWLSEIYFSNNPIEDISVISTLNSIKYIDGSSTKITELTSLARLEKLKTLRFSNTQISDLSSISKLVSIETLILDGTRINSLTSISKFINLSELWISDTEVGDLTPLSKLKKLKMLGASGTKIRDLSPLSKIISLRDLWLPNNQINDLIPLQKLTELMKLNIKNCQFSYFPEFLLDLDANIVSTTYGYSEKAIQIENNPWQVPPIEILVQGKPQIRAYFKSLRFNKKVALNEVKVILIGEGYSGKTSLIKNLFGQPFNINESQTHGIKISKKVFIVKNEKINVYFWDFGGQEIMHATHQFFLTERSVYVLVLDSRKDEKAEY